MEFLHEEKVICPYCGEQIVVLIEPTDIEQKYIEDCQVCCKPINFSVTTRMDGELSVLVQDENEI